MANILLLDESDVAERAMHGILARGNHRVSSATNPTDAWRMLRAGVVYDLVILEVKLTGGGGVRFLQRLRDDWFFKPLPVVVYTSENDATLIRRVLGLGVQNYLVKPYNDDVIHSEVAKAVLEPWRNRHFEEAKSFCALLDLTPEALAQRRREVMAGFDRAARTFPLWADNRRIHDVFDQMAALVAGAKEAGIKAGIDLIAYLREQALNSNWMAFEKCGEPLEFASQLVYFQLNPGEVPPGLEHEAHRASDKDADERLRWDSVNVDVQGPVVDPAALTRKIDKLAGCPVVGPSAAAFQMLADGRASTITQLMDLVANDPGLCAQILCATNRLAHDDLSEIDDPRTATSLLGEKKLQAIVHALPVVEERHFDYPPMSWTGYWMFQVAVGRVAQFVCRYLEFDFLVGKAATAGLLHDLGTLLLMKVEPLAFQAIVRYAREHHVPRIEAERRYLGCTTQDLAAHFARTQHLPAVFTTVIRWMEAPALATEHLDLIAITSVARHICQHAHIGWSGDPNAHGSGMIDVTPAWSVLRTRLFPSFDVRKFEVQAHAFCLTLRNELSGQRGDRRPAHAQRAAELV
ncbi:HDOD domain-containing protein [Horticoccus sp. 23ND18S-11]|uniref:HDOD domain-containing protein n=1 Tax=Horticoccus sp. 23ND18S-11 TaxID=3391832 RepID=UPI0039C93998